VGIVGFMSDRTSYLIYSSVPEAKAFARNEGAFETLEAAQAAASALLRAGREVVIAREEWRGGDRGLLHTGVHRHP
jgi:hypothetical protein